MIRPTALLIVVAGGLAAAGLPGWIAPGTASSIEARGSLAVDGQVRRGMPPRQVAELAAGKMLVAARGLADPNFAESVVLLLVHGPDGAAGLVVNVRTTVPLAKLFERLEPPVPSDLTAFAGGPVSRDAMLGLLRATDPMDGALPVVAGVQVVTTRELLEKLAASSGADRFRVYLGRAGWGAGQLEREIELGAWHVFDAHPDLVFDPKPDTLWDRQIRRSELRQVSAPHRTERPAATGARPSVLLTSNF